MLLENNSPNIWNMTQLFIYICVNNNERIREIIPELISHRFIDTLIFIRTLLVHFRVS